MLKRIESVPLIQRLAARPAEESPCESILESMLATDRPLSAPDVHAPSDVLPPASRLGERGTSRGIHLTPGADNNGWTVRPPIPLRDGTTVRLFKDGEGLKAAFDAIKNARIRVCLEVYIFHSDSTGWAFARLLADKASEGLPVYVIYDSFGSIDTDPALFQHMRRAGVKLQEFHPIRPWDCKFSWRPWSRDHRKLLVVDHDIAGMGGMNIGAEYAGSWVVKCDAKECDLWRDNAVGIVGPAARFLLRSFARTWYYLTHGGRLSRPEFDHPLDGNDLGLLASVPARGSKTTGRLFRLVRGARESIRLTAAYFAPADELIDELCRAARRGVRVQLMLPGRCDVKILRLAAQGHYETLMLAGVEVYEREGVILHAKTLVIDDALSVLGSTNLDYRSIEYNYELSVLIRSKAFGQQMSDLFRHDVRHAKRISLATWRYRPAWDRFVQWAVSRARYLL